MRIIGVVIRLGNHGDDFAGTHVKHEARSSECLELGVCGDEFVAQCVLYPKIDGKLHWILQPVGGEPGHVERREAVAVEPLLHAGDTLVVNVDMADHMRHLGAVRVSAFVFV